MPTDEERVEAFLLKWFPTPLRPEVYFGMQEDLLALLREVRDEGEIADPTQTLAEAKGRAERRIYELFAERAPPGAKVTEAEIAKLRQEVVVILKEELIASGVSEVQATTLAALLGAATSITKKE